MAQALEASLVYIVSSHSRLHSDPYLKTKKVMVVKVLETKTGALTLV